MKLKIPSLLSTIALTLTSVTYAQSTLLPVWDFEEGIRTEQNGFYNHYERDDSSARTYLVRDVARGEGGRSMRIDYNKGDAGYCGVWFHLFDESRAIEEREYVDVFEHPYLSFWVRGEKGGEDAVVQMADPAWVIKEDSKPAGSISKYLGGPISTNWQEVVVPFEDFRLDVPKAGSLTLNFATQGKGSIYIDDINFKTTSDAEVPVHVAGTRTGERDLVRAMWVWLIDPILEDPAYREDLFAFCKQYDISELFLQIPYRFIDPTSEDVQCEIQHPQKLREFLKEARSHGVLCHALDGYPEFVLEAYHPRVLAMVQALINFNEMVAEDEQFYGIHLDNEPYQLLGFEGPQREGILLEFLDLNQKIMELLDEKGSDMVYGVDIPFWFDEGDEYGDVNCVVTFNGKTQDAAKHLIDILDNVGIMDYRNFAGGADGMIRHGQEEIEYANTAGKKIYLGLETFKYRPTTVSYIYGPTEEQWYEIGKNPSFHQLESRVKGFPVRQMKAGKYRLIGLAHPEAYDEQELQNALIHLYEIYGVTRHGGEIMDASFDAAYAVSRDGSLTGSEDFKLTDKEGSVLAAGFRTTATMLEKITFADLSKSEMEQVMSEVADAFKDDPSFIGFAIHYYDTYRKLRDR